MTSESVTLENPTTTTTTECPDCAAALTLQNPVQGEILDCDECGVELEVRRTDPLTVEPAPEEEEDWGE
jgi:alpha-aminoadipate/glutamate carrier protein LysW